KPAIAPLQRHSLHVEAVLNRHNAITYHLRPVYLMRRVQKLWSYMVEGLTAGMFVNRLLSRLAKQAAKD
ncbi:MAG: hypothetical protein CO017_04180, partial [Zetaproteobacteria bacterium CG_4_8_14_3_um_filter_59_5]